MSDTVRDDAQDASRGGGLRQRGQRGERCGGGGLGARPATAASAAEESAPLLDGDYGSAAPLSDARASGSSGTSTAAPASCSELERPDIIAVHGMWETGAALHTVRDELAARGWRVHCPTLPGHGRGAEFDEAIVGNASMADYERHVEQFVASLRLPRPPILLGFSMGGLLVQMLASRLPVAALVLLAPAVQTPANFLNWRSLRAFVPHLLRWMLLRRPSIIGFETLQDSFANGHDLPLQREIYGMLCPESGRICFEMALPWADPRGAVRVDHARFDFPVLLLVGSEDRICTEQLQRVHNLPRFVRGVDYRVYPGAGHWLVGGPGAAALCGDVNAFLRARLPRP